MKIPLPFDAPVLADEQHTERARMVHYIIWSILLVMDTQFVLFFLLLPQHWERWLAILITLNLTLPFLLMLNWRGRTRLAGLLFLTELWMMATVLAMTAHGIHALVVFMFLVNVLIGGLLFGGRGGIITGIVFCFTALGLVILETTGDLPKSTILYTELSMAVGVILCVELAAIFQFLASRSIKTSLAKAKQELAKRQQAEVALKEIDLRYREVFDTTSDCIFLLDVTTDGRFLCYRYNPACEKTIGLTTAEVAGRSPEEIFPPDLARAVTANYQRCVAQGSLLDYDEIITSVRGQHYNFHTTLIPVKDDGGRVSRIVGVAHNITERKQAEAALRRSRDELEMRVHERTEELRKVNSKLQHSNTELQGVNQELEAFSYSVSHDLRQPLRTVTAFTEILMADYGQQLPADAQNLLTMTQDGALQMNQLIDALLRLSHIDRQPLVPRPVHLTALMRQTVTELKPQQPERKMEISVAELPDCMGDPILLRQVCVNLLSNAMKYSRDRPVAVIEAGFKIEHGQTVYFVRDNGAGFDMQYSDKLFGVFQRLHGAGEFKGTGVGLSIVRRIIHRHGGRIWAEAAVDQGATFYFTIPDGRKSNQKGNGEIV